MEEVEEGAILGVRSDEGAPALLADEDPFRHELVDRLADRADRHVEALGELGLARDCLASLPFTGRQAAREPQLYFLVERTGREASSREGVVRHAGNSSIRRAGFI